jgi:hypothetical protein
MDQVRDVFLIFAFLSHETSVLSMETGAFVPLWRGLGGGKKRIKEQVARLKDYIVSLKLLQSGGFFIDGALAPFFFLPCPLSLVP